ncbi:CotH kinase family protein, partial [bacterium]|nr:CotH kinase family protein [bacterium]
LHIYINGVYWGLYNVVERPDSSFAESYIEGADRDLWEGQNSGSAINDASNLSNWNNLRNAVGNITSAGSNAARDAAFLKACGFNPDGTRNSLYPIWCDPSNNADYFITNWYGGNSDWPNKNYYGGIDTQSTRSGFKYFMWDSEWSLFLRSSTNYNRITDYRGIAAANNALQDSPEFRLRFADRAHRALFNDGPLTPTNARRLYDEVTAQHRSILNPEAARWGDQHGGNRNISDWEGEYNRIVNSWFPVRDKLFLDSLRSSDLYPRVEAPVYSQHGGSLPSGTGPTLRVPSSVTQIYYMFGQSDNDLTDYAHSLDPRLTGGAINPAATLITLGGGGGGGPTTTVFVDSGDDWKYLDDGSNQATAWRAAAFNDTSWDSGPSQLGYGDGDEATVVSFGGDSRDKHPTTYFRKTFTIADPSIFEDFTLNFTYDDSTIIYLNGTEVARENIGANPTFDEVKIFDQVLSAAEVQAEMSVAPVTPQPPTDIALSNTNLAPNSASNTLVGTLTTSDPNGDNAHTYSLVSGPGGTNNDLFTIINSDELRAVSLLGGFGTSYSIRIRTTDGDSLTREESFSLKVESAMAPTAITLPINTLLQGTPSGTELTNFITEDPNNADNHTYQLVAGTGDTNNALFTINGSTLRTASSLPNLGSNLSFRVRSTDLSGLAIEAVFTLSVVSSSVRINEFLANSSSTSLSDEDGDTPDWIELHNPDGRSISLGGMYLTDDPSNLTKWLMPNISLGGNDYLIIFASSKDRRPTNGDNLHSNFSLNAGGEYVALVAADGSTILSEVGSSAQDYPSQKAGIAYGFFGEPLQIGYLLKPTPAAENDSSSGIAGFVKDTDYSISRGFYDDPFPLVISSATPGAIIRYTTDGSWPSETNGAIYSTPIMVDRTMAVKALAYRSGFVSTNIDTHTYILVNSVADQTASNTRSVYGLPSNWGGQSPYYGMENNANVNPDDITDDLKTVPSLSIAIDSNDMFGGSGIYSNPGSSGQSWERKTSLELVDPADPTGAGNFQQNCAIRIQGGAFRSFGLTRKKSFRVLFKTQFGTSDQPTGGQGSLKFPLFGTDPGVA